MNAIDESEMINPVDQSGGFGGFRGCVLARAQNIFPPKEGVFFFGVGRVANPSNPETRRGSLDGSGRDALHGIPVRSTLPGVPWSPALSWLHTALAGSCCRDPRLSSHVLIRSAMLSREHHVALSVDDLNHYYFYCHR